MKPSFALNLSHDGISLLHRAQSGWLSVGDVPLDAPDLMDELVVLRRTAADLDAQGLSTKLVIPNSQILYLEIEAPGPSRAEKLAQIREALVGMTPYKPEDLVFDWRSKGKTAQVAVVARETLTEAETFATQYRFNPVSFVAIPANGTFDGEPFFGPTRHAVHFLEGGETVEPDKRRIKVVGKLGDRVPPVPQPNGALTNGHADPVNGEAQADVALNGHANGHAVNGNALNGHAAEPDPLASPEADAQATDEAVSFSSRRAPNADEAEPPAPKTPRVAVEDLPPPPRPAADGSALPKLADLPPRRMPEPEAPEPVAVAPVETAPEPLPPVPPRRGPMPDEIEVPTGRSRVPPPMSRLNGAAAPDRISTPMTPRERAERAAAVDPNAPELARRADRDGAAAQAKATMEAGVEPFSDKQRGAGGGLKLSDALARIKSRTLGVFAADDAVRDRNSPVFPKSDVAESESTGARSDPKPLTAKSDVPAGPSRLLAKPNTPPLPRPKLSPLPKVAIKPRGAAPAQADARSVPVPAGPATQVDVPHPATETEADAMTVFGARGQTPPAERSKLIGPLVTTGVVVALVAVALGATYVMRDVARDWFGVGAEIEVTDIAEPPPLILPEGPVPGGDGPIGAIPVPAGETGVDTATVEPPQATAPDAETPPSVPLPGLEITALQPDTVAEPTLPDTPSVNVGAPDTPASAEASVPEVVSGEDTAPPELPAATEPEVDLALALAPPVAPEAPPAPLDEGLLAGAPPPGADVAPGADTSLGGTISTRAPEPPLPGIVPNDTGTLPSLGAAPGTIDIVRLPNPATADEVPLVGLDAPPLVRPSQVPPPSAEEALAFYDRTGISVRAPERIATPTLDRLTAVVLSDSDVALADPKPRGLPTAETFDLSPALPRGVVPPLPLTFEFDLDERGLVRATEEGALTPQGVTVYRGLPDIVPPTRPVDEDARLTVTPEPETDVAAADPDSVESEFDLVDPEGGLAAILDAGDLAEAEERAQFGGLTLDELADIRPPVRPGTATPPDEEAAVTPEAPGAIVTAGLETVTDAGTQDPGVTLALLQPEANVTPSVPEAPPVADTPGAGPLIDLERVTPPLRPGSAVPTVAVDHDAADTEVDVDTSAGPAPGGTDLSALAPPPPIEGATELAVDASLTPPNRPADFDEIVTAALDAAPDPTPTPTPTPGGVNTPPVSVAPDLAPASVPEIPSSASVAATATDENALRLNKVNLIGVYGSANDRRALVRLASGRYVKVQVGDQVDRGRVVAIGDDRLSYVKGGRTIVLELPSG